MTLGADGRFVTEAVVSFTAGEPGKGKPQTARQRTEGEWSAKGSTLFFRDKLGAVRRSEFTLKGDTLELSPMPRVVSKYRRASPKKP